jgi:hypothetical protein
MSRVLEILLIIGIVVNLLKGADLILRTHQQKWIQDRFEHVTLWLEDTKPIDWFAKRAKDKVQIALLIFFIVLDLLALMIVLIHFVKTESNSILAALLFLASVFVNLVILKRIALDSRKWLCKSSSYEEFFGGFLKLCAEIFGGFFLLSYLRPMIRFVPDHLINLALLLILPPAVLFLDVWLLGFLLIFTTIIFNILEIVLKLLRGAAWRIVEYNKGAYAAIILLITIVLGFLELYLKPK